MIPQHQRQMMRLNKWLASLGYGSRREIDDYLTRGWIQVNGQVVTQLGTHVLPDPQQTRVQLLGPALQRQRRHQAQSVLLHKPLGILSCPANYRDRKREEEEDDDDVERRYRARGEAYPTALDLLTPDRQYMPGTIPRRRRGPPPISSSSSSSWKDRPYPDSAAADEDTALSLRRPWPKMAVAGRLDIHSTGLLLLTPSGSWVRSIIGTQSHVVKEYLVRVLPTTSSRTAPDTTPLSGPPRTSWQSSYSLRQNPADTEAKIQQLKKGIFDDPTSHQQHSSSHRHRYHKYPPTGELLTVQNVKVLNDQQLQFFLTAGRHYHIRRMCAAVGWQVQALKRVAVGPLRLGDLPVGQWRYLQPHERQALDSLMSSSSSSSSSLEEKETDSRRTSTAEARAPSSFPHRPPPLLRPERSSSAPRRSSPSTSPDAAARTNSPGRRRRRRQVEITTPSNRRDTLSRTEAESRRRTPASSSSSSSSSPVGSARNTSPRIPGKWSSRNTPTDIEKRTRTPPTPLHPARTTSSPRRVGSKYPSNRRDTPSEPERWPRSPTSLDRARTTSSRPSNRDTGLGTEAEKWWRGPPTRTEPGTQIRSARPPSRKK